MFGYGILCEDDSDSEDDEQCTSLTLQPLVNNTDDTKPNNIVVVVSKSAAAGKEEEDGTAKTKNSNNIADDTKRNTAPAAGDEEEDGTAKTKNSNSEHSSSNTAVYTAPYTLIAKNVFIMHGKEETRMSGEKIVIYNNSKVSLFWGKCFLCGCVGHSQRYCPLKYCSKCGAYGHSMVTCIDNKGDLNLRTNRIASAGGIHPSMTSQNWRKNNRRIHKSQSDTAQNKQHE